MASKPVLRCGNLQKTLLSMLNPDQGTRFQNLVTRVDRSESTVRRHLHELREQSIFHEKEHLIRQYSGPKSEVFRYKESGQISGKEHLNDNNVASGLKGYPTVAV